MKLYYDIKARYLQWKRGMDQAAWDHKQWNNANIVNGAGDATNYFQGFKYVIPVSYNKVNSVFDGMLHWPCPEIKEYCWPNRETGQHAMLGHFRGYWNQWDGRFHFTDLAAEMDQMFVATNNEQDALMIALRFS